SGLVRGARRLVRRLLVLAAVPVLEPGRAAAVVVVLVPTTRPVAMPAASEERHPEQPEDQEEEEREEEDPEREESPPGPDHPDHGSTGRRLGEPMGHTCV